jgi:CheY-like chemotaxis protein
LAIEDNPANLVLIDHVLRMRPNIELITAVQASLGILLARQHQPDLILLDLNLPDLSGNEVLARLKADPSTAWIPVIVVSADATRSQFDGLVASGAHASLTKPIDIPELLDAVDRALSARLEEAA